MTKSEKAQLEAIEVLKAEGFLPDGCTAVEKLRWPTTKNPVFGGVGGKLVTLGGRLRFSKPGSVSKVTVGKITTCFYLVVDGQAQGFVNVSTKDLDKVKLHARIDEDVFD